MITITASQDRQMATIEAAARAASVTAHTPGPWAINEDNELVIGGYSTGAGPADFSNGVQDYPEAMANMRLASAAPELLEACQALLADNERAYPADLGNTAAALGRAAIAKAEGR